MTVDSCRSYWDPAIQAAPSDQMASAEGPKPRIGRPRLAAAMAKLAGGNVLLRRQRLCSRSLERRCCVAACRARHRRRDRAGAGAGPGRGDEDAGTGPRLLRPSHQNRLSPVPSVSVPCHMPPTPPGVTGHGNRRDGGQVILTTRTQQAGLLRCGRSCCVAGVAGRVAVQRAGLLRGRRGCGAAQRAAKLRGGRGGHSSAANRGCFAAGGAAVLGGGAAAGRPGAALRRTGLQ